MKSLLFTCGAHLVRRDQLDVGAAGIVTSPGQQQAVDPMDLFGPLPVTPVQSPQHTVVSGGDPVAWQDPFAPPSTASVDPVLLGHERSIAMSEGVTAVSDRQYEEAIEQECVHVEHSREETTYEAEQAEVDAEMHNVKKAVSEDDLPGPEHECGHVWHTHRGVPAEYFRPYGQSFAAARLEANSGFRGTKKAKLPNFPDRLGEIVIQEVIHKEKSVDKHVKLDIRGCSSCPNDMTTEVEWGGLSTVNEIGQYHGGSRSILGRVTEAVGVAGVGTGEIISEVRSSYNCVRGRSSCREDAGYNKWVPNTKEISLEAARSRIKIGALPIGVKRASYAFSSYKGDTVIEAELGQLDTARDHTAKQTAQSALVHSLHAEEKHIPFNHKLEQLHIKLQVCEESGGALTCSESSEELVLHDQALVGAAAGTHMLLNEVGDNDICSVGHCSPQQAATTCVRECQTHANRFNPLRDQYGLCRATDVSLAPGYAVPEHGMWSCVQERVFKDGRWQDVLVQHDVATPMGVQPVANGLFFREGSESKAHVTGQIQWHVTVPAVGGCLPILEDGFYVGMGVDESDVCGNGGVDLDLGLTLYRCEPAARASTPKALGDWDANHCTMLGHRSFYDFKGGRHAFNDWIKYSNDNQGGEGEGDDEWFFMRMDGLKDTLGATHVAISAHVYGCTGDSSIDVRFSDLEGAFLRFASGPVDRKNFKNSETVGYVDLDAQFANTKKNGGLVAVLFLEPDEGGERINLAKVGVDGAQPTRHDAAAKSHMHWQLVATDIPLRNGKSLGPLRNYPGSLDAVTAAVFEARELEEAVQVADSKAIMKEGIGHGEGGSPLDRGVHNLLVTGAHTELEHEYSHPHGETGVESAARKTFNVIEHGPEFLEQFTQTLSSGALGASAVCVAPSWVRQKARTAEATPDSDARY